MTRSNGFVRTVEHLAMKVVFAGIRILERGRAPAPEPGGPQRVLVCKWCCMGDAIVSLYALREFKARRPDIAIDVLVSSRVAAVYRRAPEIGEVHVLPITGHRLALELIDPRLWIRLAVLLLRLRRTGYSQFIDLELYRGTGPVLKRLLGIPFSRGFQVEGALPKHHDFEAPLPREMPEWQCFYRVLGMDIPRDVPEPLYGSPRGRTGAAAPGGPSGSKIGIVFGSSFNWPQKKWPWERYAELITLMSPEGHEFILLGAPNEREEAAKISAKAAGKVRDTSGLLDYEGLLRQVSECDVVVGNDTGTMHLAAAGGIPTVTLFGPTDPAKWNPLTSTPIFLEHIPCRPCYYLGSMPPCSHFSCLRKMEPALVAERIRGVLAGSKERRGPAGGNEGEPPAPRIARK
ncbi:MAG: lipopolysaccharide heptosyltransferase [Fibrobacteres bacterium]|nr:lipopolysaccharide heptosyltransferase [Fibrobacterota bacterium]